MKANSERYRRNPPKGLIATFRAYLSTKVVTVLKALFLYLASSLYSMNYEDILLYAQAFKKKKNT